MKRKFLLFFAVLTYLSAMAQDIIVTNKAERIEALITEVSSTEIRYKKWNYQDGPVFVAQTSDLSAIIYKNGEVQVFGQDKKETTSHSNSSNNVDMTKLNLATVDQINGVYVFSDCKPIGEYEVLGTVNFAGGEKASTLVMPVAQYHNGVTSTHIHTTAVSEEPQYTSIRNGLITNAILANRQVEGIILSIEDEGVGVATMIKFKENVQNKNYALVNCYSGYYVFTDCTPVQSYSVIGEKGFMMAGSSAYTYLRDKLVKKCRKSYDDDNMQGLIIHIKEGGKDSAEAIRFK